MEFTITKQFIIEAHKAACSDWKNRIEKEFPEAFKSQVEIGKWYKGNKDFTSLIYIKKIEKRSSYNIIHYYGFTFGEYSISNTIANTDHEKSLAEATDKEVKEALIAEAKKRGFVDGAKFKSSLSEDGKIRTVRVDESSFFDFYNGLSRITTSTLKSEWEDTRAQSNPDIFHDGIWAEILPEEKTVITKEKALKILAKKYGTTPENIEIQ